MSDLIERQAAIDALNGEIEITGRTNAEAVKGYVRLVKDRLERLPSAQPERLTDDDFETIRILLNAYKEKLCNQCRWKEAEEYQRIIDRFMAFASAQPDPEEWNSHTVACLLAELFGDACACNYNGIDEWLPEKCEVIDACQKPAGVACWEQFLKHRAERRTDEQ